MNSCVVRQSGYCLKKASFFRNFPTILVFAVFGTIISAMIVGVGTFWLGQKGIIYELSFLNSIVYGALLASTDPVATLAIFQALKVDETLYMLAFGESVINDAGCNVTRFSQLWAEFLGGGVTSTLYTTPILHVFGRNRKAALGGPVVLSQYYISTTPWPTSRSSPLEISLMLVFSYMPYLLAASMRLSGIMAIFVGGIIMSHYTQWNLSEEARKVTAAMFKTLSFAAETFLFSYIGLSAVDYTNSVQLAVAGLGLCLVGRALNIFPLAFITNQASFPPLPQSIWAKRPTRPTRVQFVLWFSGLRGIISFALALNVPGI
ncbi:Cation/H+ exchanger [Baffinella frigidus]|nr:Cation/H+ exchanger [Cryptophyta sp. CCMP2293]